MATGAELGMWEFGFRQFRKVLASVPQSARLNIFLNAANETAGYVRKGMDRATAADELHDIAVNYGLADDEDALQFMINNAFSKTDDELDRRAYVEQPQQQNGHDRSPAGTPYKDEAPLPIPLIYPFPIDGVGIKPRPWIVPGLLLRRQVTVLVAPPASGKSLLTLQVGMICTAGTDWAGWRPRGRSKVLVVNAEEDEDEMRRRLFAAQARMELSDDDLRDFAIAGSQENMIIAKADNRTKTVTVQPMLHRIIATVKEKGIDIVVVDPFAETFEGDENSNSELKWAAVAWRRVAREANCAVLLVHHTKKYVQSDKMAGDMDAARGAGALVGVARLVATLFTMSQSEAERFDVDEEERVRLIRFDDAKANQNLIQMRARWFRKHTFTLPNGDGELPADEVGVLVPWVPKDDELTDDEVNRVLDEFAAGCKDDSGRQTGDPYTVTKRGKANERWGGNVISGMRPAWPDSKITKMLKGWLGSYIREVEAETTKSKGAKRKGIKVVSRPERPLPPDDEVLV